MGGDHTELEVILPPEYVTWYDAHHDGSRYLDYGTTRIAGDRNQESDDVMYMIISGTAPNTAYNRMTVTGHVTLDGELRVVLADGFVPVVGDSFVLVGAESVSGTFSSQTLPALPGRTWVLSVTSRTHVCG